jgi:hypothetical protein
MDHYLRAAFVELLNEDGLAVMAKGIGAHRLLIKFLKYFSAPAEQVLHPKSFFTKEAAVSSLSVPGPVHKRKLVICINVSGMEESILEGLIADGVMPDELPKIITADIPSNDRADLYSFGGCFIVTSRILIVDLLDGKLDPRIVDGILIPNAHR